MHNVLVFSADADRVVLSGSMPEQGTGFNSLEQLGVKTVISVDAALPEVELANERGMRYIHIPIKYSGISEDERAALALALRESESPIYVHCHHGKHRGPAAAAIGLVGIGACAPDTGLKLMELAGTSEQYPGLFEDVGAASKLDASALASAAHLLVETARVESLPGAMAEIDRVFENLVLLETNGWVTPARHPDLSAASESGQLADLFRVLATDETIGACGEQYSLLMEKARQDARLLELHIDAGDWVNADKTVDNLHNTCLECHGKYR